MRLKTHYQKLNKNSKNQSRLFDIPKLKEDVENLTKISLKDNFWNDNKKALEIINTLNDKKEIISVSEQINTDISFLLDLIELNDETLIDEIDLNFKKVNSEFKEFKTNLLFTDKNDKLSCLLDIHPGAGGTEAQDWAQMLMRMYVRFCERNKLKCQVMDYQDGDEAGIKSVTLRISGKHAYGLLKSEKGVHRLVRISPFDANKRRHTSFASVSVVPEFDDLKDVKINESELKIDTYHSQGAGGQNVNKTESAVRITHLPTGIVVSCQVERSQMNNKETALNMLKAKLMQLEQEKRNKELANIVGEQKNIEWGSQIRSYVFCPYTLVKDNRTNYEEVDVNSVMDGNIINFIYAYLEMEVKKC